MHSSLDLTDLLGQNLGSEHTHSYQEDCEKLNI